MTQQQLAARLAKPQSYIAKIEGGERRHEVLEFSRLAAAMKVDPSELFRAVTRQE